MKDNIDEAAERLVGGLLNLETTFEARDDLSESDNDEKRHSLIVVFIRNEFPALANGRAGLRETANRLIAVMEEIDGGPVQTGNWDRAYVEPRALTISGFLRYELGPIGSHP